MRIGDLIIIIATFSYFNTNGQSTTVYTCKGGYVSANIRQEFTEQQIQAANAETQNARLARRGSMRPAR